MSKKHRHFSGMGSGTVGLVVTALVLGLGIGLSVDLGEETPETSQEIASADNTITSCFTPGQNCTAAIVSKIDRAQESIYVQAFAFTSKLIADALVVASARGVTVKVLADRGQMKSRYSQLRNLISKGIDVKIDKVSGLAHNKIMIIDGGQVITGSFNFTSAANKRNSENVVFVKNEKLAGMYLKNWRVRAQTAIQP